MTWRTPLSEFTLAVIAFVSMMGAALLGLVSKTRPAAEHLRDDNTINVVRLVANLFVVMTSLVIGLMLNSAKNTLDTNTRNIHMLATELIQLDRVMRALGPEAEDARRHLLKYIQLAVNDVDPLEENRYAEASLDAAGASLRAIRASDRQKLALWIDARRLYRRVVRQRWVVIDAAGGSIPTPLIVLLITWLAVIFASFGYWAPLNPIVTATFFLAALLMSATVYLIVDMDTTTTGIFRLSNVPFQRAFDQLRR